MEAIESLGIDWKLLIAQIINFAILLILLKKFLYTPILNMLDQRKGKIEKGLKDSEEAEKKLAECETECKKISQEAVKESEKIIASARKLAETETKKIIAEAEKKSQKIITLAQEDAESRKENALKEAKKELIDLIALSTEKVLGKNVDKSSVGEVVSKL